VQDGILLQYPTYLVSTCVPAFCVNGVAMNIGYSQMPFDRVKAMLEYGYMIVARATIT